MQNLQVVVCSVLFAGLASAQPSPIVEQKSGDSRSLEGGGRSTEGRPRSPGARSPGRAACSKGSRSRARRRSLSCSGSSSTARSTTRAAECSPVLAREAIFSNPDVIRRVNADFVPVALKAGLVNHPPDDDEGRLYREIGRSKPVPAGNLRRQLRGQGARLGPHVRRRQERPCLLRPRPGAVRQVSRTRRNRCRRNVYMKFPSQKLADIEDNGKVVPVLDRHPEGNAVPRSRASNRGRSSPGCSAGPSTRTASPWPTPCGRKIMSRTASTCPVQRKRQLAKALADAGTAASRSPRDLTRQCS